MKRSIYIHIITSFSFYMYIYYISLYRVFRVYIGGYGKKGKKFARRGLQAAPLPLRARVGWFQNPCLTFKKV